MPANSTVYHHLPPHFRWWSAKLVGNNTSILDRASSFVVCFLLVVTMNFQKVYITCPRKQYNAHRHFSWQIRVSASSGITLDLSMLGTFVYFPNKVPPFCTIKISSSQWCTSMTDVFIFVFKLSLNLFLSLGCWHFPVFPRRKIVWESCYTPKLFRNSVIPQCFFGNPDIPKLDWESSYTLAMVGVSS